MAAHRALVFRTDQEAAKQLPLHPQIKVLAGGVVHVYVHGSDGDALPRARDRICRIVRPANAGRVRIEDGITEIRLEIDERVERGVPGAVGPDVVEDAVVENAITAADRHLALPIRIPSKT